MHISHTIWCKHALKFSLLHTRYVDCIHARSHLGWIGTVHVFMRVRLALHQTLGTQVNVAVLLRLLDEVVMQNSASQYLCVQQFMSRFRIFGVMYFNLE